MFGGTSTTGAPAAPAFGSTAFGSNAFGSTSTASQQPSGLTFGTKPGTTFGAFGTSAFGTQTATSLGSTTFGSPSTTQVPAFGSSAFGTSPNQPSAFGTTPTFGAAATAFGTPTQPSFGGTTAPAFGSPTPQSSFSFGQQPSAFGTQTSSMSSAFGMAKPSFGAIAGAPSAFASSNTPFGSSLTSPTTSAFPSFSSTTNSAGQTQPFGTATFGTQQFGSASSAFPATTQQPSTSFSFGSQQPTFGLSSSSTAMGTTKPTFGASATAFGPSIGSTGQPNQAQQAPTFGTSFTGFGPTQNAFSALASPNAIQQKPQEAQMQQPFTLSSKIEYLDRKRDEIEIALKDDRLASNQQLKLQSDSIVPTKGAATPEPSSWSAAPRGLSYKQTPLSASKITPRGYQHVFDEIRSLPSSSSKTLATSTPSDLGATTSLLRPQTLSSRSAKKLVIVESFNDFTDPTDPIDTSISTNMLDLPSPPKQLKQSNESIDNSFISAVGGGYRVERGDVPPFRRHVSNE
jgi:hypothetical protein